MVFEVYTQDGFCHRGQKEFKTLEELIEFVNLHECYGGVAIQGNEIFIMNANEKDLF